MKIITYTLVTLILIISCAQGNENNGLGGYIDDEEYQEQFIADKIDTLHTERSADSIITDTTFIDFSNQLIDLLDKNKLISFSHHFHPEKGCTFAPYTFIDKNEQIFTSTTFEEYLVVDNKLTWGFEDGSGDSINLSVKDYFKRFVYDIDFKNKATDIHINSDLAFSNTQNNIGEFFPEADYIEFYSEGTSEYEGMDWSSITFYIEKFNNTYYLVAVIHNQWTI